MAQRLFLRAAMIAVLCMATCPAFAQPIAPAGGADDRALLTEALAREGRSPLALDARTTVAGIVAAWGSGNIIGPGGLVRSYRFQGSDPGSVVVLWLSFEPGEPGRLTRALLFIHRLPAEETSTILFNALPITTGRRCDQFGSRRRVGAGALAAAWGPPDRESGSGLEYWHYRMADGGEAVVLNDSGTFQIGCHATGDR